MKAEKTSSSQIIINLETADEFSLLWHLLNMPFNQTLREYSEFHSLNLDTFSRLPMWESLNAVYQPPAGEQ